MAATTSLQMNDDEPAPKLLLLDDEQELDVQDDDVIYENNIDKTLRVSLQFDKMMGTYSIRLSKLSTNAEEEEDEKTFFMTENVTKNFIRALDKLKPLIRKYLKSGSKFCYKLELTDNVYVTFGRNTPQYGGSIFIDIRNHFSDEDGHIFPTKVGIRFNPKYAASLKASLTECLDKILEEADNNQVILN